MISRALLLFAATLAAEDLPRGQVVPRVPVAANPDHSYALYLPSAYSPDRTWPILYALEPGARGQLPVDRYAAAAEKLGVIVVGSHNSRNGSLERSIQAIDLLYADTHTRFRIDDRRLFATGFSGGARLSLLWAKSGQLRGVIACGAGFMNDSDVPKQGVLPFALSLVTGDEDFNYEELRTLHKQLPAARYFEFAGPHQWPPAEVLEQALAHVLNPQPNIPAFTESKEQRASRERFYSLVNKLQSPSIDRQEFAAEISYVRKDAARTGRDPKSLVARRVLSGIIVGRIEDANGRIERRDYRGAADSLELAALAAPDRPNVWLQLARAYSGLKDLKRARQCLDKARALGFEPSPRNTADPLLAPLLNTSP